MPEYLETCGVFFQCYRNLDATDKVLSEFRCHYPDATVWLISDGGDNASHIAQRHRCNYWHDSHVGQPSKCVPEVLDAWLRRLLFVCHACQEPWVLILEDDVLIRGKMKTPPFLLSGAGIGYKAMFARCQLAREIRRDWPGLDVSSWVGAGGTLMHRETGVVAMQHFLDDESYADWQAKTPRIASDIWLTFMFLRLGNQTGANPDVVEPHKKADWAKTDCAIAHQAPIGEHSKMIRRRWYEFVVEMLRKVAPPDDSPFYMAEIGVADGQNAKYYLENVPNVRTYLIDPWQASPDYLKSIEVLGPTEQHNQSWFDRVLRGTLQNVVRCPFRVHVLAMRSTVAAAWIPDGQLSFAFIDGMHTYDAVLADCRAYWPKIRPGGVLSGHDYLSCHHPFVHVAVNDWAKEAGQTVLLPRARHLWYVEKAP